MLVLRKQGRVEEVRLKEVQGRAAQRSAAVIGALAPCDARAARTWRRSLQLNPTTANSVP